MEDTQASSSSVGPSAEMAALLTKTAEAEEDVRDAKKALKRAEERDPTGTGSEVSRKEQILIGAQAILHDLYEERLAAAMARKKTALTPLIPLIASILYLFSDRPNSDHRSTW